MSWRAVVQGWLPREVPIPLSLAPCQVAVGRALWLGVAEISLERVTYGRPRGLAEESPTRPTSMVWPPGWQVA